MGRQRNRPQMKEQENSPKEELEESSCLQEKSTYLPTRQLPLDCHLISQQKHFRP